MAVDVKQTSLLALVMAALFGYVAWSGSVIDGFGIAGLTQRADSAAKLAAEVEKLQGEIDAAKRELAKGSVQDVREKLEQNRASLRLLRRLVPEKNEVPDLLDEVSVRAKRRGVAISAVTPKPVEAGPGPFDTYKYDVAVMGPYDNIGRFIADIATLNRIVVPFDLNLRPANDQAVRALGQEGTAMVEARFQIRTFVKSPAPEVDGSGT
ncbi:MAG: type 4a pilus biogenesis protein PilO [Gemmatimonadales bacterium]|nr:type 4a pilus biogenesis protein PilO [Gemmatimonadales bacterium]